MSLTVVVREALCVYAGGAVGLQYLSGCEKCEVKTRSNEVAAACST